MAHRARPADYLQFPRSSVAAHALVSRMWGPASTHPCVDCGKPAKEWAYDGTDPSELYGPSGRLARGQKTYCLYSRYPEYYMPLCRGCHRWRDGPRARKELYEYREWRTRTRMTLTEVDKILNLPQSVVELGS